jgi:hypothetical protein
MKYCVLDYPAVAKVLDDDAFEQLGSDSAVPDPLGVDHDDRSSSTDAETWRLAAFDTSGPEQQVFPLEEPGEQTIQLTATSIG